MLGIRLYRIPKALALFLYLLAPATHAQGVCTPVTSLPALISTEGMYCLTGNLATGVSATGAIRINHADVTLDLNGWVLDGQAAGSATSTNGVFSEAANVTVRNGVIRGFAAGVALSGPGAVVENLLVDKNTGFGIFVAAPNAVVRRNRVVDTGGSTLQANVTAMGIEAVGPNTVIEDNIVIGLMATGTQDECGICVGGANSLVRNNFVTDTAAPTGGGTSRGILAFPAAANVNVLNNTISNVNICIDYLNSATGIYAGNTVTDCDTPFSGGEEGQQSNNYNKKK